ncbi:hypothetical protein D3C85_328950 [compost metagenome]
MAGGHAEGFLHHGRGDDDEHHYRRSQHAGQQHRWQHRQSMFAQHRTQRQFDPRLALRLHGHEHRGFAQPAPQVNADHAEHTTEQERITPGVIEDFRRGEDLREERRGQRADQITEGQPGLQKAQRVTTMAGRCVLGDKHPGTRHLPADRRALQDAQRQQQQRREITDLGISRHDPDQQARQRHHQDAQAEDFLTPEFVGEMRHQNPAQRPRQITGDENPEALQQAQPFGHFRREEQLAEGQGEEYENDEIVNLQRPAKGRKAEGLVVGTAERHGFGRGLGGHGKELWQAKNQGAHGLRKWAGGQPVRP